METKKFREDEDFNFFVEFIEEWHVPTDAEWKELEMYLGMSQEEADGTGKRGTEEGNKLKETGTEHWDIFDYGTNEVGFTARPGGRRPLDGDFDCLGTHAYFWPGDESDEDPERARGRRLINDEGNIARYHNSKKLGFSVRCVKD